jgi:hypothetical protein
MTTTAVTPARFNAGIDSSLARTTMALDDIAEIAFHFNAIGLGGEAITKVTEAIEALRTTIIEASNTPA